MGKTQGLYPAYCTECGKKIERRLFPLDSLLKQYHYTGITASHRDSFLAMVRIHGEYGQPILPPAPALIQDGKYHAPAVEELTGGAVLPTFSCPDNQVPLDTLIEPALNIGSMIAQFYRTSGFAEIYEMLELMWEKKEAMEQYTTFPPERQNLLDGLCDRFIALPYVRMHAMSVDTSALHTDVENALGWVLEAAAQEALTPTRRQFALRALKIGWRYKILNNREVPQSLVVADSNGQRYDCTVCCCSHCFKPILKELGAYPQKIIGLLGSQQTGKTTYLAALTDSLIHGNIGAETVSGELKLANITFEFQADEQKRRIYEEKSGLLWLYQHGFPPHKTDVLKLEDTSSPTFLARPGNEESAAVMYTLADIAGEVFLPEDGKEYAQTLVDAQKELLRACSALILVVNSQQVSGGEYQQGTQEPRAGDTRLAKEPQDILNSCKDFLPSAQVVPVAVIMTASDKINGGDLRKPLHLAYDLRKVSPWVWSGERRQLVLNDPVLQTVSQAVGGYLNGHFGVFTKTLEGILKERYSNRAVLAAFAVSNGTQMAPVYFADATEEEKSEAACDMRCKQVRSARFGIAAPLLWLMAQNGIVARSSDNAKKF